MGVCYTVMVIDIDDWRYVDSIKSREDSVAAVLAAFDAAGLYQPEVLAQWDCTVVYDLGKRSPLRADIYACLKAGLFDVVYACADNASTKWEPLDPADVSSSHKRFEAKAPNLETVDALHDSRNGVVTRIASVDDLFADLDD